MSGFTTYSFLLYIYIYIHNIYYNIMSSDNNIEYSFLHVGHLLLFFSSNHVVSFFVYISCLLLFCALASRRTPCLLCLYLLSVCFISLLFFFDTQTPGRQLFTTYSLLLMFVIVLMFGFFVCLLCYFFIVYLLLLFWVFSFLLFFYLLFVH